MIDATFLNNVPADVWLDVPVTAKVPVPQLIACIDIYGTTLPLYERRAGHVWQIKSPCDIGSVVFLLSA